MRIIRKVLLYFCVALLLISAGWQLHIWYSRNYTRHEHRRVKLGGFQFVNPLLDVELPEGYGFRHEMIPFKQKVKKYVDRQINSGAVTEMSVYFRDLSDGPWFGINEDEKFAPASLLKLDILIAWLKRAEKDPKVLEQTFVFDEKIFPSNEQNIKPLQALTAGARYTVEELLRYMMNYSDNKATWLLFSGLSAEELKKVDDDMDVTFDPEGKDTITVHGYSGFFRILYNASYLSREMSEKALKLMSHQAFRQGIFAGVPNGVVVSSKFGEAVYGKEKQLHEFGIVYHPKGPYILGIMTRGYDLAVQTGMIRDVSALIYNEVLNASSVGK